MKRGITLVIICLFALMLLVGIFILNLEGEKNDNVIGENNDVPIDFFTIKTHSGFNSNVVNKKYKITNKEELKIFYTLYNGFELSNKYDLSNNTMFIQTQTCASGSMTVDFKDVSINEKIEFNVNINKPEIGTMDMAYWYLVAIIPNNKLDGVNVDEWKSPIEVNNSL